MSTTDPDGDITIRLPGDLGQLLRDEVSSGRYPSEDQAVTAIVRECLQRNQPTQPVNPGENPDPIIGLWKDCADEIDEMVTEIYRRRREEPWRKIDL